MKQQSKFLLAACAVILFALSAVAAETQLVNGTGYGLNVEEAKRAAVRSAVEAVVGTLIDSETLVENDELVEDKILSYSSGMVEDVKIVGAPKMSPEGLVKVRVQVKVKKTELVERLKAATQSVSDVDGESLYQKVVAARQNLNEAKAIMTKLFSPERIQFLVKAGTDQGDLESPIDIDYTTGKVTVGVKVETDIMAYRQWVEEILEKLGPMATKKWERVVKGIGPSDLAYSPARHISILVSPRSLKAVDLEFDKDKKALLDEVWGRVDATLKVSLLDKFGDEIKIANESLGTVLMFQFSIGTGYYVISPVCSKHGYNMFEEIPVSMGVLSEQDIRDIDSVSVEVVIEKKQ